jgi:hypothetical protein
MGYVCIVLVLCFEESGQFHERGFAAGILILDDFFDDGVLPKNLMFVTLCATVLSYITSRTAASAHSECTHRLYPPYRDRGISQSAACGTPKTTGRPQSPRRGLPWPVDGRSR